MAIMRSLIVESLVDEGRELSDLPGPIYRSLPAMVMGQPPPNDDIHKGAYACRTSCVLKTIKFMDRQSGRIDVHIS